MDVRTDRVGRVGVVELHRPDQVNALTVDLVDALAPAAEGLVESGARAVVLTGSGSAFCAGADLSLVRQALDGDADVVLRPLVEGLHAAIRRLRALPAPLVAAVEGPAVGAGLGLALCADLRVLAESARLIPGYVGIGSSPDGGVSYFLARALGPARATRLLLRNEPLDATAAEALGLADEIAADGSALATAVELAEELAGSPPLALLRVRELVDASSVQSLTDHLDHEQRLVEELWSTHDFREGVSAFLERRQPRFRGD
jgi:2-(1,2-epoxy-1,2-dihydrophenyl)acetyl-CoA isomerase